METALFSDDYDHLAVVQHRTDHDSIVLSLSRQYHGKLYELVY